jgi:hypothetical protein
MNLDRASFLTFAFLTFACLTLAACGGGDFAVGLAAPDAAEEDASHEDEGTFETGVPPPDTGVSSPDTGVSPPDTGAPLDTLDTGAPLDTTPLDTGKPDTGPSCTPPAVDLDGDGEAPPPGVCGTDCHDGNKDVFSKQWRAFATPYTRAGGGPSFDYNCDGVETRVFGKRFSCTPSGTSGCTVVGGYLTDAVPACGAMVSLVTNCTRDVGGCVPVTTTYKQECN